MSERIATALLILAAPTFAGTADGYKADVMVVPVTTITKFDPYMGNDMNLNKVMDQVALNLVALDDSLSPIPELAKSWSINSKSREITFELFTDKKFHDGTPIEPSDVYDVFRKSIVGGSDLTSQIDGFKSCARLQDCQSFKVRSKTQFTLKLTDGNFPLLLRKLAGVEGVIFRTTQTTPFIGSGPYKVTEVTPESIVTERVDPKSPFRQIVFKKVGAAQGLDEFKRGTVDVINNIEFTIDDKDVPKTAKRQDLVSVTFGFVFQIKKPSIFHQKEIRQAISLAIDKNEFIKHHGKRAIPANGLIPKGFLGYEDREHRVDIEKAKTFISKHVPTDKRQVILGLRDRFKGVETKSFKELSIRLWDFPYHKLAKQMCPFHSHS